MVTTVGDMQNWNLGRVDKNNSSQLLIKDYGGDALPAFKVIYPFIPIIFNLLLTFKMDISVPSEVQDPTDTHEASHRVRGKTNK